VGTAIPTIPPEQQIHDPLLELTVDTLDAATQTLKLGVPPAASVHTHLAVFATGNLSTGRKWFKKFLSQIAVIPPGWTSPIDISSDWSSRWGTLTAGSRVGFAVEHIHDVDGYISPRIFQGATATGTADAMQLIASIIVTTPVASISFASIPQSYSHLLIVLNCRLSDSLSAADLGLQINGDTAANYDTQYLQGHSGSAQAGTVATSTSYRCMYVAAASLAAAIASSGTIWLPDYTGTTFYKTMTAQESNIQTPGTVANYFDRLCAGLWRDTSAITQIDLIDTAGGNIAAGSRFDLYGLA
jgi:hypothetical protein